MSARCGLRMSLLPSRFDYLDVSARPGSRAGRLGQRRSDYLELRVVNSVTAVSDMAAVMIMTAVLAITPVRAVRAVRVVPCCAASRPVFRPCPACTPQAHPGLR